MVNDNVRLAVEHSGLKQKYLAEKLGCSEMTMSAMLNGNRKITVEEFFAICKILGMGADQLYHYSNSAS